MSEDDMGCCGCQIMRNWKAASGNCTVSSATMLYVPVPLTQYSL